ncbi:MAG TPA: hypothetical protein VMU81_19340 [Acetobacteraceae bacterium]|nr:hypothetical protein [Acetobacteraceae bacterium]
MNGAVFLAIAVAGILGPVLFASIIADLTRWQITLLAAVACLAVGYFVVDHSDIFHRLYWQWTEPTPPADEATFIAAANDLRRQRAESDGATTDRLRQAEARICALPADAANWVGRVAEMYLTAGQQASLQVEIWPGLIVRTAFFAEPTGTLIRASSPVFSTVSELHDRDNIIFSGHIVGHDGACLGDPPVNRNEKLRDPEFLFFFTKVKKTAD